MKDDEPEYKYLGPMKGVHEPAFKRNLESHLSFNPHELDFDNPAQIMIFARMFDNVVHTPSPHTTEAQLAQYQSFLQNAHEHAGDLKTLSQYFLDAFPSVIPYLNAKEVLVNIIDDTTKAITNKPAENELNAIVQVFEAITAILNSATGLIPCILSANRALSGTCAQWRKNALSIDQVVSAALALKQNLFSE